MGDAETTIFIFLVPNNFKEKKKLGLFIKKKK